MIPTNAGGVMIGESDKRQHKVAALGAVCDYAGVA